MWALVENGFSAIVANGFTIQFVCIRPSPVRRLIDNVATVRNPNICARQTGPHGVNVSVLLDKMFLAKFEQNGFLSKKQKN